ncbi:sensor histidine kinase [Legionella londiniensis]|uniref:histidine kinase n=1 Tax=Legionella londiniensis TaxID=45068 RepID=A0A0W0VSG6_9GAMM|nr:HAMP domain-containing sensor histidine kinase [Legionella londiniensis]KTD23059.1 sensor protein LuxN [Legionella londiniensis]STX94076.1 sensor protein LuxN [Legionella londiniensis]
MDAGKKLLLYLNDAIERNMIASAHHLMLFGAIAFLGFPLSYIIWKIWYPQFDGPFYLQLIGSLLGLGLMLAPYWPAGFRSYLPWYWFLTLLYVLPFFFMHQFLANHASDVSSMALLSSVFFLVLIVDVFNLCILLVLGFGLALIHYYLGAEAVYFSTEHAEVVVVLLFVIIAGSTVNYKTSVLQQQRMKGIAAAAGMIAHELRTPLLGIKSGALGLNKKLPRLFEGYELAEKQGLLPASKRKIPISQLRQVTDRIISEIDYANTIIEMLLMKAGHEQKLENCEFEPCSMNECLQEAMLRYPFKSDYERALVSLKGDFRFLGSKLLMQHVIFNLLKNALYAIETAQKGEISIWTEEDIRFNYLHFLDTAKGIPPRQLARMFDHFYTTTFMGTGIGLSFCKLVLRRFGGDILCESKEGKFTQFILSFPKIEST